MSSERILFVDDDPVSRRAFARAMRQSGFIVDLAKDGDEAWELATHFPYAVIATDLRMPGMDGMMLIDQLRELQPDPVCLLVTGCKQLEWYREANDSSVDVIQKPWNGDHLAEALRQAINEYRKRSAILPSEQPVEAGEREVATVGLSAAQRDGVGKALGASYRALHAVCLAEATELLCSRLSLSCCLVDEALAAASQLQQLARAGGRVPLVVLGSGDPETGAVRAIRNGAQDWVSKDALDVSLARAVAVARERSRTPRGPLPVCTESSNPNLLFDRLRQATSRARRFGHRAAVLIVDIDRFGDINHSLGYDAGDELLALVAERLRSSVRESDAVFRLRQDEFALVLEDLGAADAAGARLGSLDVPAQRVLNSFATPFACRGHEVVLTASIGGAVFPTHGQTPEELIKRAEAALQQAKHDGRNRYCTYSEPGAVIGAQGGAAHAN